MIKILLDHGANPGISFQGSTAWHELLKLILRLNINGTSQLKPAIAVEEILASLKLLLESGAVDVNAKVEHGKQLWSAASIIESRLSRLHGANAIQAAGCMRML
jgi:hypothetical protein